MRNAKFRVYGAFDSCGSAQVATVTIDRDTKMFKVRPLRRKRTYELTLADVASWVCKQIILAEWLEKRRSKKGSRKGRRAA